MGVLTLEDVRLCNHLDINEMASIMGVDLQTYDYYIIHPEEIECVAIMRMCRTLNIGVQYIKTRL